MISQVGLQLQPNVKSSTQRQNQLHGKNGFVTATKLGQQIKFLLLQPKILLQQPNVLLTELNTLLL